MKTDDHSVLTLGVVVKMLYMSQSGSDEMKCLGVSKQQRPTVDNTSVLGHNLSQIQYI